MKRFKKKTTNRTLRLPDDLVTRKSKEAAKVGMSFNEYVVACLNGGIGLRVPPQCMTCHDSGEVAVCPVVDGDVLVQFALKRTCGECPPKSVSFGKARGRRS